MTTWTSFQPWPGRWRSLSHPFRNRNLCHWPSGLRAGIYLKRRMRIGLLSKVWLKKLRMAASLRRMSLASGHWFLYVLILDNEMEKLVLKFESESFWESKFFVASAYPSSRHLPRTNPEPQVPGTNRVTGSSNLPMICWSVRRGVSVCCQPPVNQKHRHTIFHKL